MKWTDERIEQLKELHAEGLTGRGIATRLGGVTKNAVIGKLNRLGLSSLKQKVGGRRKNSPWGAPAPARKRRKYNLSPATASQKTKSREKYFRAAQGQDCDPPPHERIGIMELTGRTCRWPIGDPGDSDFAYCGRAKPIDGKPYCKFHALIASGYVSEKNKRLPASRKAVA